MTHRQRLACKHTGWLHHWFKELHIRALCAVTMLLSCKEENGLWEAENVCLCMCLPTQSWSGMMKSALRLCRGLNIHTYPHHLLKSYIDKHPPERHKGTSCFFNLYTQTSPSSVWSPIIWPQHGRLSCYENVAMQNQIIFQMHTS